MVNLPEGWKIKEEVEFQPQISIGKGGIGLSLSPRPVEKSLEERISEKISMEKAEREARTVLEKMSSEDQQKLDAMLNVLPQIETTKSYVKQLPKDYFSGVVRSLRMKSEYLKDPELARLGTAYGLLTSTLLRQFQGSRPSDFDYKIWETITGARAVTADNMLSALNYTHQYVLRNIYQNIKKWSVGYDIPENKLWKMIGLTPEEVAKEYTRLTGRDINQRIGYDAYSPSKYQPKKSSITLPDGSKFILIE